MTCNVLMGPLNPTHSLTHSLTSLCINVELCVAFPVVVFVVRIFVYKILEGFMEKDLQDNFQLVEHLNVAIYHISTLLRPDCFVYFL